MKCPPAVAPTALLPFTGADRAARGDDSPAASQKSVDNRQNGDQSLWGALSGNGKLGGFGGFARWAPVGRLRSIVSRKLGGMRLVVAAFFALAALVGAPAHSQEPAPSLSEIAGQDDPSSVDFQLRFDARYRDSFGRAKGFSPVTDGKRQAYRRMGSDPLKMPSKYADRIEYLLSQCSLQASRVPFADGRETWSLASTTERDINSSMNLTCPPSLPDKAILPCLDTMVRERLQLYRFEFATDAHDGATMTLFCLAPNSSALPDNASIAQQFAFKIQRADRARAAPGADQPDSPSGGVGK
jgi:hypothetical protein